MATESFKMPVVEIGEIREQMARDQQLINEAKRNAEIRQFLSNAIVVKTRRMTPEEDAKWRLIMGIFRPEPDQPIYVKGPDG